MKNLYAYLSAFALLAALLAGCTPAAQPPVEESGATTTASFDAPFVPSAAEITTAVAAQSTDTPTTGVATRPCPSGYTERDDVKACVTAVTQDACPPFTVAAGDRSDYRVGRLPSIDSSKGRAEAVIIRSLAQWEAVAAENKPESAPAYDAAFFERGVLVLLVSHCNYWNYQLRITDAAVSGGVLTLEMGYIIPAEQAPMMTDWLVLIELKKEDVEGVDALQVDYWESRWAYPDEEA